MPFDILITSFEVLSERLFHRLMHDLSKLIILCDAINPIETRRSLLHHQLHIHVIASYCSLIQSNQMYQINLDVFSLAQICQSRKTQIPFSIRHFYLNRKFYVSEKPLRAKLTVALADFTRPRMKFVFDNVNFILQWTEIYMFGSILNTVQFKKPDCRRTQSWYAKGNCK